MAEHRLGKGYFTCIKVAEVNRFVFLLTVCFVGFNKTTSSSFFFSFCFPSFFPLFVPLVVMLSRASLACPSLLSLVLWKRIQHSVKHVRSNHACSRRFFFFFFEQHKAEYRRGSCLLCHGLRRKPSVTTVIEPSAFFSFLFFFFLPACVAMSMETRTVFFVHFACSTTKITRSLFLLLFFIALLLKSPRLGLKEEEEKKESLHFFCERGVFGCFNALMQSVLSCLKTRLFAFLFYLYPFLRCHLVFLCVCAASAIAFSRIRSLSLYLFSFFQRCNRTSLASRG